MKFRIILLVSIFILIGNAAIAQSINVATGSYCVGNSTIYYISGSCTSYNWYVMNGSNGVDYRINGSNTGSSVNITWLRPFSGNVVCYATCNYNSMQIYGPNFSISNSITPSVSIIANPGTTVCQGSSVTFTATPTNGGSSPNYNWRINGTTVSSGSSKTFTRNDLVNGDVISVVMYSNASCVSTSTATSNSISMSITPASPVSVSVTGPTSICSSTPTSASFIATVTNGGSSAVYTWYKNGVQVTGISGPPPYVYAPQTPLANGDKIKCRVTSNASCVSGNPAMSNEVTVTLTPSTTPSVGIQITKINYCSGENISFTASSSFLTSYSTYSWKLNGTQFSTSQSTSLPISNDTNAPNTFSPGDVVTLNVTGLAGTCLTTSTASSTTAGIPITISNPTVPTVSIVKDKASYCDGDVITLSASSSYIVPTSTYKWKLNGTQFSTSSTASLQTSVDPNAPANVFKPGGVVTVEVSNLSGYCISPNTASASLAQSAANIIPFPNAVTVYPSGLTTAPSEGLFYWGISGGYNPSLFTFQWRRDGVAIPGMTKGEPRVNISELGTYDVVVSQSGCSTPSANSFTISSVNQRPIANAGEDFTAYLGQPVTIDGSASFDPDGSVSRYYWAVVQYAGSMLVYQQDSNDPRFTFTPNAIGTYKFRLSVYDDCNCVVGSLGPNEKSVVDDYIIVTVSSLPPNNFNAIKETQVLVKNKLTEAEVNALQIQNGGKSEAWKYFDGLGRVMQTVQQQGSPAKNDIVVPNVYDKYGREFRKYLPVVVAETNGYYKVNSDIIDSGTGNYKGIAEDFYKPNSDNKIADDLRPFSETTFDASPLNRPTKDLGVGKDWLDNNKAINYKAPANVHGLNSNLTEEKIIIWKLNNKLPERNTAINSGYYPIGSLLIKSVKDEQGNEVREYSDRLGRVVLKKVQVATTVTSLNHQDQWACTYFIYDDFGNVVFVLQPELCKSMLSSNTLNPSTTDLHNYAFQYTYDEHKRMVVKKLPGADSLFMIYDIRNRIVLTQDGNQRKDATGAAKRDWSYIKYDFLNRPVMTGIYTHPTVLTRKEMIGQISTSNFVETYNGTAATHGYTNTVFPTLNLQVLSVTYYDNYKFRTDMAGTAYDYKTGDLTGQDTYNPNVKRYKTGTKVNILGTSNYLWSITYYDQKYRVLQVKSQNHKNGVDRVTNLYDFVKLIEAKSFHTNGGTTYSAHRKFEYDHAGRLWRLWHKFHTESAFVLLQENVYNELGQLVTERLHSRDNGSTFAQNTDFLYNIRGWLETINSPTTPEASDLFSVELKYNKPSATGGPAMYNGNISEQVWKTTGLDRQAYGYKYDPLNRLLEANYFNQIRVANNGRYTEKIYHSSKTPYDLNGNINGLIRNGRRSATQFGVTDKLEYKTYTGNQLTSVDDTEPEFGFDDGFKDAVETSNEYTYDANGNMIIDKNKGLILITYNNLNLPVLVKRSDTDYIVYTYDATGRKLTQKVFGATPKTTEYLGEYIYENTSGTDVLQFVSHEQGRVVPDNTPGVPRPWEYQYFLKDHLGNVRVTFSEKKVTSEYKATLEDNTQSTEMATFRNYSRNSFSLYNHTAGGTYSQLLNASSTNGLVGLAKSFAVNPGDVFDLEAYAKYEAPTTNGSGVSSLLTKLLTAFNISAGGSIPLEGAQANAAFNSLFSGGPFVGSASAPYEDASAPRAYLNYILFDENFVLKDFGFDQISIGAKQVGVTPIVQHDYLNLHVKVQQKGYLYIYLSNEQAFQTNVYFDDFKITQNSGVNQVNDYYPFGLIYNAFSKSNSINNSYKFNGMERQDELDIGWDLAEFRSYSPDIGRWHQIDPKTSERESGYAGFANNPIFYSDPLGDTVSITTNEGKYLFMLDDGMDGKTSMTAKSLYDQGTQWFEPEADNYMKLIGTAKGLESFKELKHFSWEQVENFSEVDRWMSSYRQGGSGDWKSSKVGADGYYLVTVGGKPYWADAIGQIPFAVDKFTDELLKNKGNTELSIRNTINSGREYGEGKLVGGTRDNSNTYDTYFILRGALWAKQRNILLYDSNKDSYLFNTKKQNEYLKKPITPSLANSYLK